jgi:biopolymer transport protein ExbD
MAKRVRVKGYADATLDMTPIIDSVFLLLIFFMVTTVLKNPAQLKMTIPEAYNPTKMDKKIITVELTADGLIAVAGKQVALDQFDAFLVQEKQKTQNKTMVIKADKEAKHGDVLKLMKLAKEVQIEQIGIVVEDMTEKEKNSAPPVAK